MGAIAQRLKRRWDMETDILMAVSAIERGIDTLPTSIQQHAKSTHRRLEGLYLSIAGYDREAGSGRSWLKGSLDNRGGMSSSRAEIGMRGERQDMRAGQGALAQ